MPSGVYKKTEEHIKKIVKNLTAQGWNKGKKTGKPSWNSGTKGICKSNLGSFTKGQIPFNKGKHSGNHGNGFKKGERLGIPRSVEVRKKISKSQSGELAHNWKGGLVEINKKIRKSLETKLWREAVFARDDFTCQKYGTKGGKLHPHHIQNFSKFPELRFAIDNGITLSDKAHRKFHHIFGNRNNSREQLQEFLLA